MFGFWSRHSENRLGVVVIIPLLCNGHLQLTSSSLKQVIFEQTRQNGYQTASFGMYIYRYVCDFTTYT